MFVGLGIDANLGEDGMVLGGIGGHEVVAGRFAIAAATQSLAVEGDGLFVGALIGQRRAEATQRDTAVSKAVASRML